jgi:uncharacterized Zn-finger protein
MRKYLDRETECKKCGKAFANVYTLARHVETHNPNKKHACKVCGKKFSLPQYLKEHEVTHTNDRPFICPFVGCGKNFRQAGKLSLHKKIHLNEKDSLLISNDNSEDSTGDEGSVQSLINDFEYPDFFSSRILPMPDVNSLFQPTWPVYQFFEQLV